MSQKNVSKMMSDNDGNCELQKKAFEAVYAQADGFLDRGENIDCFSPFITAASESPLDEEAFVGVFSGVLGGLTRIFLKKGLSNIPPGVRAAALMDPKLDAVFQVERVHAPVLSRQTFKFFDVDQDGLLSAEDLRSRLTELADGKWEPLLPFLDVDGDGEYRQADYISLMTSGFQGLADYAHRVLDALFDIIVVSSPLMKNAMNMVYMFLSKDGVTLDVETILERVPSGWEYMLLPALAGPMQFVNLSKAFSDLHVHLEAKLRSAAEEDQVSLEDYEEIFIPEFAKRVVELEGLEPLEEAQRLPPPQNTPFKVLENIKRHAETVCADWGAHVCEGLFHFVDFKGEDIIPLEKAIELTSIFKALADLGGDLSSVPKIVVTHLLSLIKESPPLKITKEEATEGSKALLEVLKGAGHLVMESLSCLMWDYLFSAEGDVIPMIWSTMTGSVEDGPVPEHALVALHTTRIWTEVISGTWKR